MSKTENLNNKESITKLKSLVDDIMVCLFCTDLKTDDGATCNIWFFSEKNSDKNKAIAADKDVQLFFSHPGKSSYLVVNGEAGIILDKVKIEELWSPTAKIWFKEGKGDSNISVIKVAPSSAYYWDTDSNQMINFLKIVASVVTGTNLVTGNKGALKV
jgi:general stress protein 26